MQDNNDNKIHDFCDARWNFHIAKDGAYYPSKHDDVVLKEAANKFNISIEEAKQAFDRIAKLKADTEVKGMSKSQMVNLFKNIVEGNAETPWGQAKLKKQ